MTTRARRKRRKPAPLAPRKARLDLEKIGVIGLGGGLVLALAIGVLNSIRLAPGEAKATAQLYKNPQCTCCEAYANHLRQHGYAVTATPTHNLSLIRREHGVPERLAGCHTTLVGGYVVEGHVPVAILASFSPNARTSRASRCRACPTDRRA